MANALCDIWRSISSKNVYKNWIGGVVTGALFKQSLFNSAPLRDTLNKYAYGLRRYRSTHYGICNADKANFEVHHYDNTDFVEKEHIESVMASSAIPAIFPPVVDASGETLVDGGAIWNSDLPSAVNGCRDLGYKDSDIILDIILCGGAPLSVKEDVSGHNTYQNFMRYREMSSYYKDLNNLEKTHIAFPDVTYRSVVYPTKDISQGMPMSFTKKQIDFMINLGIQDAKNALKLGGPNQMEVIQEFNQMHFLHQDPDLNAMMERKLAEVQSTQEFTQ